MQDVLWDSVLGYPIRSNVRGLQRVRKMPSVRERGGHVVGATPHSKAQRGRVGEYNVGAQEESVCVHVGQRAFCTFTWALCFW